MEVIFKTKLTASHGVYDAGIKYDLKCDVLRTMAMFFDKKEMLKQKINIECCQACKDYYIENQKEYPKVLMDKNLQKFEL